MRYFKSGNTITLQSDDAFQIYDQLPVGVYLLKFNEMQQKYYLETTEELVVPKKIYGKTPKQYTERVIRSFKERDKSTGVLFTGTKGAGKSMTTKLIMAEMLKLGYPVVILMTEPSATDEFKSFMSSFDTPVVIFMDEFEKICSEETQKHMLSVFDGTNNTKKLFLLTANNKYMISDFMINRPGRVYYHFKFGSLESDFIEEYIDENLNDKAFKERMIELSGLFAVFSFDMLEAFVEEVNRYGSVEDAVSLLNFDIMDDIDYTVAAFSIDSVEQPLSIVSTGVIHDHDVSKSFGLSYDEYRIVGIELKEKESLHGYVHFKRTNVKKISDGGMIAYEHEIDGRMFRCILAKEVDMKFF